LPLSRSPQEAVVGKGAVSEDMGGSRQCAAARLLSKQLFAY
jgi:hypothetical protein